MDLNRTPLLIEVTNAPDPKKGFYGGRKQRQNTVLVKPDRPTSDGVRKVGFGKPGDPSWKNVKRWTTGVLRTEPKAPTGLNKIQPAAPKSGKDRKRRLMATRLLARSPLLIDHHSEG